ncbi:glutamyl-tRNA synthetase [Catalinimonas alkaloidigena]|uniref:Glutamyl-tRNA synthetase n=1 Tax=Catalinimonas alkaloidigena TaxID=1075417 RepID=A0A1G8ZTV7_9BACT|nr:glutamyl-tRNA synthetase [Catalinimonas alkaloidigena]
MHLGNAFSFVLTWLLVRHHGGTLHLRIDDADAARVRPEYVDDIFHTLAWLGLDWDTGPEGPADFYRHYSQQLREALYQSALQQLSAVPEAVFACTCTRAQLRRQSVDGLYPGTCRARHRALDTPGCAWRLRVPEGLQVTFQAWGGDSSTVDLSQAMGDFVVRKKDGSPAYQLSSVVDDLHYGTTLIVRGLDLLPSTAAQVYLAQQLAQVTPTYAAFGDVLFYHHPLVQLASGEKLSKSAGAQSVREARPSAASFYQVIAKSLGYSVPLPTSAAELLARFAEAALPTSPNATLHASDFTPSPH